MNKIISLDKIETYPKKIIEFIQQNDVQEFPTINIDLEDYINEFYFNIYHCTRLKDKEFVLKSGLMLPAKENELKQYFIKILKEIYGENYDFKSIIYNYNYISRGNSIHFTTPLSAIKNDIWNIGFLQYFGGELLENIIKEQKLDYEKLKNIGKPYIVRAKMSFKEISEAQKQRIIYIMSSLYKNNEFKGINITFFRNIKPDEIIKISNGKKVLNKLLTIC